MLNKSTHLNDLKKEMQLTKHDVLVLERVGFDIDTKHLNACEKVNYLKSFIEERYPFIASQKGFNKAFSDNKYNIIGAVSDLSDLSDKNYGILIVLM